MQHIDRAAVGVGKPARRVEGDLENIRDVALAGECDAGPGHQVQLAPALQRRQVLLGEQFAEVVDAAFLVQYVVNEGAQV